MQNASYFVVSINQSQFVWPQLCIHNAGYIGHSFFSPNSRSVVTDSPRRNGDESLSARR